MPPTIRKITGNQENGVSLFELSIIITIAAIVAVGFLSWVMPPVITDAEKALITRNRMELINEAMAAFKVKNSRLPCPADKGLFMGQVRQQIPGSINYYDYDDEALSITAASGVDCPTPVGAVPTRALALPSENMLDGWGRKFLYHVNGNFCNNITTAATATQALQLGCTARSYSILPTDVADGEPNNYAVGYNTAKDLVVNDIAGTSLATAAAYVLVSYGANGFNGYLPSGVRMGTSVNASEAENDGGNVTYIKNAVVINPAAVNRYDDIVTFRTKAQLEGNVVDATTPLVDTTTCDSNRAGVAAITKSVANTMRTTITAMQGGAAVTSATDISVTGPSTYESVSTDLSVFAIGDVVTVSGFSGSNNGTFTVTNSSTDTLTVGTSSLSSPAASGSATITAYNNNGDEVVLDMMMGLQDICNDYYGTKTDTTTAVTSSSVFSGTGFNTVTFAVGSDILVSGFTNASNNGIFNITARASDGTSITVRQVVEGVINATPLVTETNTTGKKITFITKTCPGNTTGNSGGATYDYISNTCRCPNGEWDGSC
jgi:hypothetical protein